MYLKEQFTLTDKEKILECLEFEVLKVFRTINRHSNFKEINIKK